MWSASWRTDEIGVLALEFDRMVDKLTDARRRLVDRSYEAGAAEAIRARPLAIVR